MKNKKLIWLIGSIAVVVIAAIVVTICLIVGNKAEKGPGEETLYSGIGEIVYVEYKYGEEPLKLEKKKGKWQWKDEKTLKVDQEDVENTLSGFSELPVVDFVEEPEDLGQYGLKKPTYYLTMKDSSGVKKTILIGDPVGEDGMTWYAMEKGDDIVYVVTYDLIDLIDALEIQHSMAIYQQEMGDSLGE